MSFLIEPQDRRESFLLGLCRPDYSWLAAWDKKPLSIAPPSEVEVFLSNKNNWAWLAQTVQGVKTYTLVRGLEGKQKFHPSPFVYQWKESARDYLKHCWMSPLLQLGAITFLVFLSFVIQMMARPEAGIQFWTWFTPDRIRVAFTVLWIAVTVSSYFTLRARPPKTRWVQLFFYVEVFFLLLGAPTAGHQFTDPLRPLHEKALETLPLLEPIEPENRYQN